MAPLEPAADADGEEPLDLPAVPVKGGLLSIASAADSAGDGGAHRFVLTNGDGDAVATSPSFTLTGETERSPPGWRSATASWWSPSSPQAARR